MIERLIKKYPNRRLYDTEASKYITLANLKELIVSGVVVKVVDTNSDEDLTQSILMQIIMESEAAGEPIFSTTMLQQLIRFYGSPVQSMLTRYMEESMALFSRQQKEVGDALGSDPIATMTRLTEQNMKAWGDMQKSLFGQFGKGSAEEK